MRWIPAERSSTSSLARTRSRPYCTVKHQREGSELFTQGIVDHQHSHQLRWVNSQFAARVDLQSENAWLLRCLRPQFLIYNPGPEFMGKGSQYCIGIVFTTNWQLWKNPQANAICKCSYQTVTNVLRLFLHIHPPQDVNEVDFVMVTILRTAFIQPVLLFTTFYRLLQVH